MKTLKVLFITPTPIDDRSFGGAIRSNDLRGALTQVADVDTLVVQGGPAFEIDAEWGHARVKNLRYTARGLSLDGLRASARVRRCVAAILKADHYDLIVARYLGQALFVPAREWGRLVIDPDDVYKTLGESESGRIARLKCHVRNLVLARMLRRARHVWIVNPKDAKRLRLRRSSPLGNVVAVPEPVRPRPAPVPGRILMVGFFPHPPNAQGLEWFDAHVLPALLRQFPHAQLRAVGKCPPDLAARLGPRTVTTGYVPDIAHEYAQAALVVAPIASGAGSQIKVIDALANERPLVASRFAYEGFADHLVDGEHLVVADAVEDWIVKCAEVLQNAAASEAMATRAYRCVKDRYGVDGMVKAVRTTLDSLAPA